MKSFVAGFSFFMSATALGVLFILGSFQGYRHVAMELPAEGVQRDPASIRKSFDFSHLEGAALHRAAKARLMAGAEVVANRGYLGVQLGNFVVRDRGGFRVFACENYDRLILTFEADGFAARGEKPVMEVEGACRISSDINRIAPVWIPVERILAEKPGDGEMGFYEDTSLFLRFSGVYDEWPKQWHLMGLRLVDRDEMAPELHLSRDEVPTFLPAPILLDFARL